MSEPGVTIVLPTDAGPELIARLKAAFPDATLEPAATQASAAALETTIERAVVEAPRLPGLLVDWWAGLGGGLWPLFVMVAALGGALAIETLARRAFAAPGLPTPGDGDTFQDRTARGFRWLGGQLPGVILFLVVAGALARVLSGSNPALVEATRALLGPVIQARLLLIVIDFLSAPGAAHRRPMGLSDAAAADVSAAARVTIGINLASLCAQATIGLASGNGDAGIVARGVLIVAFSGAIGWFIWRIRHILRDLALRATAGEGAATGPIGRAVSTNLALVYLVLVGLDLLIRLAGLLRVLGQDAQGGAGPTLSILVLTPLAIAGLRIWQAERAAKAVAGTAARGFGSAGFALAEGGLIVLAALLLLRAWGVDPLAPPATGAGRLLPGLIEAALAIVVGFALWRMASSLLVPPTPDPLAAATEGPVRAQNRMGTIIPILRIVTLAAIAVMTVMTALTSLGVNIAPLLAGAGVLGLAIGFGAQKLVADIISGLFYLYEDAFRIGEYVETGAGKGTVERFTLRSVILRHHRGPLFTIPFSEMGTIQNHSRDWVKVKFLFDVPASTDLEMVRKVIKRIGAELEKDPELEGKFLEPLKSQGAVSIKGQSYQVACKFMTRPGEQFLVRRKIFVALQKGLIDQGIELFAPQIMVATGDPTRPMAPASDTPGAPHG